MQHAIWLHSLQQLCGMDVTHQSEGEEHASGEDDGCAGDASFPSCRHCWLQTQTLVTLHVPCQVGRFCGGSKDC